MNCKRAVVALGAVSIVLVPAASSVHASTTAERVAVTIFAPRGAPGTDCARVLPLVRRVTKPAVLTGAMRALVAGPSGSERARGYGGWFSARTAGRVKSVRVARGIAYVDFRDFSRLIPNASSSCGSALLLAQLDRTAKQFPTVEHTVYSFDGSRRAFYHWLQRAEPVVRG